MTRSKKGTGDAKTTLASLLKYMEGYEVIVELKTGRRHRGRLTSADNNMNLMLQEEESGGNDKKGVDGSGSKIGPTKSNNNPPPLPIAITRNIRGSGIRYVHFPDNANLTSLVRSGRERERNAAKKYQKTKRNSK